jgi:hypothetical protein
MATTIMSVSLSLPKCALASAACSAHTPKRQTVFSILHPANSWQPIVSAAAPTLNFAYGAYAFSLASVARTISLQIVLFEQFFFLNLAYFIVAHPLESIYRY